MTIDRYKIHITHIQLLDTIFNMDFDSQNTHIHSTQLLDYD